MNEVLTSSRSNEWETPQDFFDKLNREFHFTLDPAATPENAKCKNFYTAENDGLTQDWSGERVFCNPPYGRKISEWVENAGRDAYSCAYGYPILAFLYLWKSRNPFYSRKTQI